MVRQNEPSPIAFLSASQSGARLPQSASRGCILLVDDDADFVESLSANLVDAGFRVIACMDGSSAVERLAAGETADAVLMDWRMPGMTGLEALSALRSRGIAVPVVFLTGLGEESHEEMALAAGAADFIPKSRKFSILTLRLELIVEGQRPAASAEPPPLPERLEIGPLELRFDVNRACWRGQRVDLTLTEFRMVALMAMRAGEDASFRDLYDLVHGKDFVAGSGREGFRGNVRTFIKRIRRKFRATDPGFDRIRSYAGFGYRWTDESELDRRDIRNAWRAREASAGDLASRAY
jgi:two-component system response regulator ChvI